MRLIFNTTSGSTYEVREGADGPELRRTNSASTYAGRANDEWRPIQCIDVQVGRPAIIDWGDGADAFSPAPSMPEGNRRLTTTSPVTYLLVSVSGESPAEPSLGCRWEGSS